MCLQLWECKKAQPNFMLYKLFKISSKEISWIYYIIYKNIFQFREVEILFIVRPFNTLKNKIKTIVKALIFGELIVTGSPQWIDILTIN